MMTSTIDRTTAYLDDLARMLTDLDPLERADVLDGVRDHVSAALADLGREPNDADVDRILADLGSPGQVAEAALADRPMASAAVSVTHRPTLSHAWVPPVAAGLIFLGATFGLLVLPVSLMLAGLALLWFSPLWTSWEKALGTILPVLGLGAVILSGVLLFRSGSTDSDGITPLGYLMIAAALAALVMLVLLVVRGVRRAQRWPAEPDA